MNWSWNKRAVGGGYVTALAFIVAHSTNAFVADALYAPPSSSASMPDVVEPASPGDSPQHSVEAILNSGLFTLPASPVGQDGVTAGAPPPPPLDAAKKVVLLGTVSGKESGVMAVLEEISTKHQTLYRLGSDVPNVGTLAVIDKQRVLFREGQREEWLELAAAKQGSSGNETVPAQPIAQSAPQPMRRVLDRREITSALDDPTRLLTQAQAVPYLTDGKLDGFRLYNVVPLGLFDKIGLKTNDVVQRINGVELRDPGMVVSLIQQLRNERTVRVDLMRNAQRQTLTYDIR